jgi:hypothetical protein
VDGVALFRDISVRGEKPHAPSEMAADGALRGEEIFNSLIIKGKKSVPQRIQTGHEAHLLSESSLLLSVSKEFEK